MAAALVYALLHRPKFANNLTDAKYNNGLVEAAGTRKYFVQAPVNFYLNAQYTF